MRRKKIVTGQYMFFFIVIRVNKKILGTLQGRGKKITSLEMSRGYPLFSLVLTPHHFLYSSRGLTLPIMMTHCGILRHFFAYPFFCYRYTYSPLCFIVIWNRKREKKFEKKRHKYDIWYTYMKNCLINKSTADDCNRLRSKI